MTDRTPGVEPTIELVAELLADPACGYHDEHRWDVSAGANAEGVITIRITPYSLPIEDSEPCPVRHFRAVVVEGETAPIVLERVTDLDMEELEGGGAADLDVPVADAPVELPVDVARELTYLDIGASFDGWTVVANEEQGHGRWVSHHRLVIRNEAGEHFAADYSQGLTEYQGIRPWDEQATVVFHPVRPRTQVVRMVQWEPPEQGEGGAR